MSYNHQDWEPTVLRKPGAGGGPRPAGSGSGAPANRPSGMGGAGARPAAGGSASSFGMGHLNDAQPTSFHVQTVGHAYGQALTAARVAKNLKLVDAAKAMGVNAKVYGEFERGIAKPNAAMTQKFTKFYGCKLPAPPKAKNNYAE